MTEAERDALLLRIAAQLAEVLRIVEALPERQMATDANVEALTARVDALTA